jgi:hypothetical protein
MAHLISQKCVISFGSLLIFLLIERVLTSKRSAFAHRSSVHIFLEDKFGLFAVDVEANEVDGKQTSDDFLFRFLKVKKLFLTFFVDIAQVYIVDFEAKTDPVGTIFSGL